MGVTQDADESNTKSRGSAICGWCITGDHDNCRVSVEYYGRTWVCPCTHGKSDAPAPRTTRPTRKRKS